MNIRVRHVSAAVLCIAIGSSSCAPPKTTSPVADTPISKRASPPIIENQAKLPTRMERNLAAHFAPAFGLGVGLEHQDLDEVGIIVESSFTRLTAENSMKWAHLQPEEGRFDFGPADQLANFARKHHMLMTGHTLLWHQATPAWLTQGDKKTILTRIEKHIQTVVSRYADVTDNWDVVNEAISDQSEKTFRDASEGSELFSKLGKDYIAIAFGCAADAVAASGRKIALYYNDYNVVVPEKRTKILDLVEELRASGAQIDGIGAQAHWNLVWPSVPEIQQMIDDVRDAGLLLKISELDISIYTQDDWNLKNWQAEQEFSATLRAAQANRYREIMEVFVKNAEHISSVTFWGLSDDRSWLNGFPVPGRRNYPLLFDENSQPKPAYHALFDIQVPASVPEKDAEKTTEDSEASQHSGPPEEPTSL